MPENSNPGTPQATVPQSNDGSTVPVGNNPPSKKIAGKYDTIEEAVEHGILGMEQAFHGTREDVARLTRIMEQALAPNAGHVPVGQPNRGSSYGDAYNRGAENSIDTTEWLTNPQRILEQREQQLTARIINGVEQVVGNAMVVAEFKRVNPDLVQHEKVVSAFMRETDPSKNYQQRLADAAQLTRNYLVNVRAANGGNTNQPPNSGDYVESPRGPSNQGGQVPITTQQAVDPGEKELLDYIKERQDDQMARFGIKTT